MTVPSPLGDEPRGAMERSGGRNAVRGRTFREDPDKRQVFISRQGLSRASLVFAMDTSRPLLDDTVAAPILRIISKIVDDGERLDSGWGTLSEAERKQSLEKLRNRKVSIGNSSVEGSLMRLLGQSGTIVVRTEPRGSGFVYRGLQEVGECGCVLGGGNRGALPPVAAVYRMGESPVHTGSRYVSTTVGELAYCDSRFEPGVCISCCVGIPCDANVYA